MKPAFAAAPDVTQENVVVKQYTTLAPAAKSVTLEATQVSSAAAEATPVTAEQNTVEFTESDSGRTVAITMDTSILIHLKGQPSTGYTWVVEPGDGNILIQEGEPQHIVSGNLKGAEETITWMFKSTGAGSTVLKLVYIRPFEKDPVPLETFELAIQVDAN